MRQQCLSLLGIAVSAFSLFVPALQAQDKIPFTLVTTIDTKMLGEQPRCAPVAQSGYRNHACIVRIPRGRPISPPTLVLPANTRVYVEIDDARPDEIPQPVIVTTKTAPPDIGAGIVKNGSSAFQTISISSKILPMTEMQDFVEQTNTVAAAAVASHPIHTRQKALGKQLDAVLEATEDANVALSCLEGNLKPQPLAGYPGKYSCTVNDWMSRADFITEQAAVAKILRAAASAALPLIELTALDNDVTGLVTSCTGAGTAGPECSKLDKYKTVEAQLDSRSTDIQKDQTTLSESAQALLAMVPSASTVVLYYSTPRFTTSVLTINMVESLTKTSTTIATVTTNQSVLPIVFSGGLLFSNLVNRTFTNAQQFQNGQPVVDSNGKPVTVVTESDSHLSVVAPEALVSYRLPWVNSFNILSKCWNGCAFLVSGGVGANLTMKTADFDTGGSFQIGSLLLTPTVHFGRETRLSDGIAVNSMLGPNAPSTLPTTTTWVRKFGFGITYAIPF